MQSQQTIVINQGGYTVIQYHIGNEILTIKYTIFHITTK